jgi:glycyl-tRNA synthetase alpha subunit
MQTIAQTQAPIIIDVQYKIADVSARLVLAEQELAKTEQALKVQELRTTLQAYQKQEQEIRENIKNSMIVSGVKSLETATHKFTVKNNAGSVVIVDEQMIPTEYKKEKVTVTVDKTAIKKAIEGGQEIHGADMSYSQTLLITAK